MKFLPPVGKAITTLLLVLVSTITQARPPIGNWHPPEPVLESVVLQTSLYTTHYNPKPEHNNDQQLVGLELHNPEGWLLGGARFLNSFGQETVFAYGGQERTFWRSGTQLSAHAKLAVGIIHGYRGEFADKVPMNNLGVAPGVLPSIGLRWDQLHAEAVLFGLAGTMVTAGIRF
ncbi:MAG: hypothetical protein EA349_07565 [Halomonadaceae bacterium]|nr:MAG: hypothetical protein EA349_07565 [Halomonadaceae bacterium]